MKRFFVQIGWKSGKILYYCAVAEREEHAIVLVTGDDPTRAPDIVSAQAWHWEGDDGPRVQLHTARSFRLGSADVIRKALDTFAVCSSVKLQDAKAPDSQTVTRPAAGVRRRGPGLARTRGE